MEGRSMRGHGHGYGDCEKGEVRILVRAVKRLDEEDKKPRMRFEMKEAEWMVEFHMILINLDEVEEKYDDDHDGKIKIERECFPNLIATLPPRDMLELGPFVYMVGGEYNREIIESLAPKDVDKRLKYYYGAARISSSGGPNDSADKWSRLSLPNNHLSFPMCAVIKGKIYSMGGLEFPISIEVFDPAVQSWKSLGPPPLDLAEKEISLPFVVSDPSNDRIILHYLDYSLYAYYPLEDSDNGGRWNCLASRFLDWSESATPAVADNMLFTVDYEFPTVVCVFDLKSRSSLMVEWCLPAPSCSKTIITPPSYIFNAILSLGRRFLCLAHFCPCASDQTTVITFIIIKAQRCDTTIKLTPISVKVFELPYLTTTVASIPLLN